MEAFETIRAELEQYDLHSVAEATGINFGTLQNWVDGVHCARYTNLVLVAHAIGYNVVVKLEKQK